MVRILSRPCHKDTLKSNTMPNIFEKHAKQIQAMMPDLIVELTVNAMNFFDKSWDNQGFTNRTVKPWKKSFERDGTVKDKTLVETGTLRRSLRTETTVSQGTVFTEVEYAKIHNEGGTIKATQSVRSHTRKTKKGKATIKAHSRTINTTMPQRQFMGESHTLDQLSEKIIYGKLDAIFRK
jgi:phage gpG-like protein